jgi:hypothetical protein
MTANLCSPLGRTLTSPRFLLFFFSFSGWGETESTWYVGHCWRWVWSSRWNEDWQGKPKYSEKTCPSAILSTTNPTWPDLESNPGRRGGKPATNRLSYRTAFSPALSLPLLFRLASATYVLLYPAACHDLAAPCTPQAYIVPSFPRQATGLFRIDLLWILSPNGSLVELII